MTPNHTHRPVRSRSTSLAALVAAALLAACGKDGTSPDNAGPAFQLDATAATPQEVVVAQVRGVTVPTEPSTGTLGGVAFSAMRLDDSTLAFVVPAAPAGAQPLQLTVAGKAYATTLRVDAPVTVANPDTYLADALTAATAQMDSLLAALRATGSADTAAIVQVRQRLTSAQGDLSSAAPAERAAAAQFLAANAEALAIGAGAATSTSLRAAGAAASATADGACQTADGTVLTTYEECSAELDDFLADHARRARRIAAFGGIVAAGAALGGPVGIFAAGVSLALTAKEIVVVTQDAMRRFVVPVFKALAPGDGQALLVAAPTSGTVSVASGPVFVAGTAASYTVNATYASPTMADASSNPVIASAISLLGQILDAWNAFPAIVGLGSAPAVPSVAARSVVEPVPAAHLRLGTIDPATVTGSATVSNGAWMLKFSATGIGNDRPFTFQVRYEAPGAAAQTQTVPATLQPSAYPVATVTITSPSPSVSKGQTLALAVVLRDSANRELSGRTVTWSSSNAAKATVNASTGVVTGVDTGSVTITATSEGKHGQVTLTVMPMPSGFVAVALAQGMDASHSCAIQANGAAFCWGENILGSIGNGTADPYDLAPVLKPAAVSGNHAFASVAVGAYHSCGRQADGTTFCWGRNRSGELGIGHRSDSALSPTAVATTQRFAAIAAGAEHACGLTSSGAAYCWGLDLHGQLGIGSQDDTIAAPAAVLGGHTFSAITAGWMHTCALSGDQAWCWGNNAYGALGDSITRTSDSLSTRKVPHAVINGGSLKAIAAGEFSTCGLTTSGAAVCWGSNYDGELGDGTNIDHWEVTPVAGGRTYAQITAGSMHACALTSAGEAWCWGYNGDGQLGDGTTSSRNVPVRVSGTQLFQSLAAADDHTCGITMAGQVFCWGAAATVGDGTKTMRTVPTAVLPAP